MSLIAYKISKFMETMVFQIPGGQAEPPPPWYLGVGTKRLGKGRVNETNMKKKLLHYSLTCLHNDG